MYWNPTFLDLLRAAFWHYVEEMKFSYKPATVQKIQTDPRRCPTCGAWR